MVTLLAMPRAEEKGAFGKLGLATIIRIWHKYGGVLLVASPYRRHHEKAVCMAVFVVLVRFMYG
jgi:hypothetical protein